MATETAGSLVVTGHTTTTQTSTVYVYLVAAVVSLGSFLMGYSLVIISGAIIFLKTAFNLSPTQLGFAVSSSAIGCILGPLIGGAVGDALACLIHQTCEIGISLSIDDRGELMKRLITNETTFRLEMRMISRRAPHELPMEGKFGTRNRVNCC